MGGQSKSFPHLAVLEYKGEDTQGNHKRKSPGLSLESLPHRPRTVDRVHCNANWAPLVESWYPFWTRPTSSLETHRLPEQCLPTHQHLQHTLYPDCRGHLKDNLLSFWVAGAGFISSPTGSQENVDHSPSLLASQMPDPGPTPQTPLSPRSTLCVLKLSPDPRPWPSVLLQSP